jgi:hypothetical protein
MDYEFFTMSRAMHPTSTLQLLDHIVKTNIDWLKSEADLGCNKPLPTVILSATSFYDIKENSLGLNPFLLREYNIRVDAHEVSHFLLGCISPEIVKNASKGIKRDAFVDETVAMYVQLYARASGLPSWREDIDAEISKLPLETRARLDNPNSFFYDPLEIGNQSRDAAVFLYGKRKDCLPFLMKASVDDVIDNLEYYGFRDAALFQTPDVADHFL